MLTFACINIIHIIPLFGFCAGHFEIVQKHFLYSVIEPLTSYIAMVAKSMKFILT